MSMDVADEVGRCADTVDNLIHAALLQLPDELHLMALRESLPELRDKLREIHIEMTGENPWEPV